MGVEMTMLYQGDLHCESTHGPSNAKVVTDAPKDNMGKGESFSPTDLVGVALGTCMLTTMGIYAKRHNVDMTGATAKVVKDMVSDPKRRIGKLTVRIEMPPVADPKHRQGLEIAAKTCPVHASLHPDVQLPIEIVWRS